MFTIFKSCSVELNENFDERGYLTSVQTLRKDLLFFLKTNIKGNL